MNSADSEIWRFAGDDGRELIGKVRARRQNPGAEAEGDGLLQGVCRLAIVSPSARSVELAERVLAEGRRWSGRGGVWFSPRPLSWDGGRIALVFPGVEPEFVSWPLDLEALSASVGLEAPALPAATLSEQAASVVRLGVHLWRVVDQLGLQADEVAGHSIGEWTSAVAAGMVSRADADVVLANLDLERYEREFPAVDYVATNGSADVVAAAIATFDDVFVSHDNCPRQSMICGPPARLAEALVSLRAVGVRGARLKVRSGFHTPLLAPAIPQVRTIAEGVRLHPRRIPIWSGTVGGPLPTDLEAAREVLVRQVVEPVRFAPMIRAMFEDGVRCFLQLGVGSTPGFVEDNLGKRQHLAVSVIERGRSALVQTRRAIAALWVDGYEVSHGGLLGRERVAV